MPLNTVRFIEKYVVFEYVYIYIDVCIFAYAYLVNKFRESLQAVILFLFVLYEITNIGNTLKLF